MHGSSAMAIDGGSGNGQQQYNGWQAGGVIEMGHKIATMQDKCCQFRSGSMGV